MTIKTSLTGSGIAPLAAISVVGVVANTLTATGTTQTTALALTADVNIVTTAAASTGVVLPSTLSAGDEIWVVNYGANSLAVYPPVGGKINNGTLNASISVSTNATVLLKCIDNLNFFSK